MSSDIAWSETLAANLDAATLYEVLSLRSAVFVVEQDCAYQDLDGLDLLEGTVHLVGRSDGALAAYARVLAPDDEHRAPRIGRVIVRRGTRGQQLGRRLMERALAICARLWPGEAVEIGAQAHLAGFYGSLGFEATSAPYDEDGIPHIAMRRLP